MVVSSITIGTDTTIGTTDTGTEVTEVTDTEVTDTDITTDSVPQAILCSPVNSPVRSPIVMRPRLQPGLLGRGLLQPRQLFERPVERAIRQPGTPGLAAPRVRAIYIHT